MSRRQRRVGWEGGSASGSGVVAREVAGESVAAAGGGGRRAAGAVGAAVGSAVCLVSMVKHVRTSTAWRRARKVTGRVLWGDLWCDLSCELSHALSCVLWGELPCDLSCGVFLALSAGAIESSVILSLTFASS